MFELIAEGDQRSLFDIGSQESRFAEGDRGRLSIDMRLIPPGTAAGLEALLRRTPGIDLDHLHVSQETSGFFGSGGGTIHLSFQKGLPQLVLIAAVVAIFFVGAILLLVISWALWREPIEKIVGTVTDNLPLLLLGGVALAAWGFFGREKERG